MRIFTLIVLALTLTLAGCGGATTAAVKQSPQMAKDQKKLEKQAWACYKGPRTLTKKGRAKFMDCFVPPEKKAAAELCLQKEIQKRHIPFTRRKFTIFLSELSHCVVTAK